MEAFYGLAGPSLDLVLHSPGGSGEAAAAIVSYIRSKFSDVRVFVPHEAMSAATMLACSADVLFMGRQSYMGPIDPQFSFGVTPLGPQSIPAQAILDQFERIKAEYVKDKDSLAVWIPSLQQYGPALIQQCQNALDLSKELVTSWLAKWMFKNVADGAAKAAQVANALRDHKAFKTHARPLDREYLRSLGMRIIDLESDQQLQEKVLTVYHAAMHTFLATGATKIIENHAGRAFIKQVAQVVMARPTPRTAPSPTPAPVAPPVNPAPPAAAPSSN